MNTWTMPDGRKMPIEYLTDEFLFDLYDRMKPSDEWSEADAEMLGKPQMADPRWLMIKEEAEKRGVLNRRVILVDMDGVIADNITPWLYLYNKDYDDHVAYSDIEDYAIQDFTKAGRSMFKYLEDPQFYDRVEQIDGAFWGINYIRSMGMTVKFVTAGYRSGKLRWLMNNSFLIHKEDFIVIENKAEVQGDLLIDDYYEKNIKEFVETGRPAILFSQPWNRKFDYQPRANNWEEVIDRIKEIYGMATVHE